jgi:hypothetical protein
MLIASRQKTSHTSGARFVAYFTGVTCVVTPS